MNQYLTQLITELEKYGAEYTVNGEDSALEQLWNCYSAANPVDDGRIKAADRALSPALLSMEPQAADAVSDLVSELCLAYQRAAFLEGIQVGSCLQRELVCISV